MLTSFFRLIDIALCRKVQFRYAMDVLLLSRIQFAFTIAFHYIYPPLSIGLGMVLVIMEGLWIRTGDKLYHEMARFWTKIFALTFAMGVATGIVMEFEFGTNWATYSRYVGDVFGSALAAEGIFAEPAHGYFGLRGVAGSTAKINAVHVLKHIHERGRVRFFDILRIQHGDVGHAPDVHDRRGPKGL